MNKPESLNPSLCADIDFTHTIHCYDMIEHSFQAHKMPVIGRVVSPTFETKSPSFMALLEPVEKSSFATERQGFTHVLRFAGSLEEVGRAVCPEIDSQRWTGYINLQLDV